MDLIGQLFGEPSIVLLVDIAGPVAVLPLPPDRRPVVIETMDGWFAGRIYCRSGYMAQSPSGELAMVYRWHGHVSDR